MQKLNQLKKLSQLKLPSIYFEGLILPTKRLKEVIKLTEIFEVTIHNEPARENKKFLKLWFKNGYIILNDLRYCVEENIMTNDIWEFEIKDHKRGENKGKTSLILHYAKDSLYARHFKKVFDPNDTKQREGISRKLLRFAAWKIILGG